MSDKNECTFPSQAVSQYASTERNASEITTVPDVGRDRIEAFVEHIQKLFSCNEPVWREVSRGVPDWEVPSYVRAGNAALIESAGQHHPDLLVRIDAILAVGRHAPGFQIHALTEQQRRAPARRRDAFAKMDRKARKFTQQMIFAWLKSITPRASDNALQTLAWGGVELVQKRLAVIEMHGDPFDVDTTYTLKLTEAGTDALGPDMVAAFGGMQ